MENLAQYTFLKDQALYDKAIADWEFRSDKVDDPDNPPNTLPGFNYNFLLNKIEDIDPNNPVFFRDRCYFLKPGIKNKHNINRTLYTNIQRIIYILSHGLKKTNGQEDDKITNICNCGTVLPGQKKVISYERCCRPSIYHAYNEVPLDKNRKDDEKTFEWNLLCVNPLHLGVLEAKHFDTKSKYLKREKLVVKKNIIEERIVVEEKKEIPPFHFLPAFTQHELAAQRDFQIETDRIAEYFLPKIVDTVSGPNPYDAKNPIFYPNRCYLWKSNTSQQSGGKHGMFRVNSEDKNMGAHKVMYILSYGLDPNSTLNVCHICPEFGCPNSDGRCVNPLHLRLKSQKENMADKVREGRAKGGTFAKGHHPNQLHSEEKKQEAREIIMGLFRESLAGKRKLRTLKDIAKSVQLPYDTIKDISQDVRAELGLDTKYKLGGGSIDDQQRVKRLKLTK